MNCLGVLEYCSMCQCFLITCIIAGLQGENVITIYCLGEEILADFISG